jgi:hypothetical protein
LRCDAKQFVGHERGLDVEDEELVVKWGDDTLRLFAEFACSSEFKVSSDKEVSKRVVLNRSCVLGVLLRLLVRQSDDVGMREMPAKSEHRSRDVGLGTA